MLCIALACTMLSQDVRPSVRQSNTYRCFVETAKHIIKLPSNAGVRKNHDFLTLSQNDTK